MLIVLFSACTGPLASGPTKVYRVGALSSNTEAQSTFADELRQALREFGYVEGRNLSIEVRYAEGRAERYPVIAAELVALKLDVIVTRASQGVQALKLATSSTPIVMAGGINDPVTAGLVASLARPGGNITGTVAAGSEIAARRLQLLKEAVPTASRIAYVFDASSDQQVRNFQQARSAAATLGIELAPYDVRAPENLADALGAIGRDHPDAIIVAGGATPLLAAQQRVLDFLSASHLPSMISVIRTWVDHGALMYYDENSAESFRSAAAYIDRILKGAMPADLPIATATKFDFIINTRTAKALGLLIPPAVLAQATEIVQ